jgi:hypothetical protein
MPISQRARKAHAFFRHYLVFLYVVGLMTFAPIMGRIEMPILQKFGVWFALALTFPAIALGRILIQIVRAHRSFLAHTRRRQ